MKNDLTNISVIKNLCQKYSLHPNRKNGQNFLIDKSVLEKIVAAGELKLTDMVLEIGPGFGILTQELIKYAGYVVAVEKDKRLAEFLEKEIKVEKNNLEIISNDILTLSLLRLFNNGIPQSLRSLGMTTTYKIIANLPYQITAPVLWKFLQDDPLAPISLRSSGHSPLLRGRQQSPNLMILMVQKEVAERICAGPGKMSVLSVMCQFYADCKIVSYVSKNCFWPTPKVESAIVKLKTQNPVLSEVEGSKFKSKEENFNNKDFMRIVKIGFSAKRKMLKNNLSDGLQLPREKIASVLKEVGLNEKVRAQELGVEEWKRVYNNF